MRILQYLRDPKRKFTNFGPISFTSGEHKGRFHVRHQGRTFSELWADRTPPELLAPADTPDPFEQQWWAQMQVLAWVYPRDPAAVRDIGLLEPSKHLRVTIKQLRFVGRNGACYPLIENAEEAVIEALQAGRLTAYGLANGAGDLKEIPSLLWADLKFQYDPNFAEPKDALRSATSWYDLRFQRKDVLAVWPYPRETLAMADEPVAVETDRGSAANEPIAKPKRKAPDQFVNALIRLIAEICTRAAQKEMRFDVTEMPGTKADFRELAIKFDADLDDDRTLRTFDDYLAGLVSFKQGARHTHFYQDLFPEYFRAAAV